MKKNILKEMFTKTKEELTVIVNQEIDEVKKMSLYLTVKKPKNTRELFMRRKKIAQLKTIIREKEILNV